MTDIKPLSQYDPKRFFKIWDRHLPGEMFRHMGVNDRFRAVQADLIHEYLPLMDDETAARAKKTLMFLSSNRGAQ